MASAGDAKSNTGSIDMTTPRDIEKAIGDLVDLCAANPVEAKAVDPRTWAQLLIYAGFHTTPRQ